MPIELVYLAALLITICIFFIVLKLSLIHI